MIAATIIREARRRAGISQTELANRLATSQSVVGRWETGARTPSIERVVAVVRACELDLHLGLANRDADHERLIDDSLRLTPTERLRALLVRLQAERVFHRARRLE